MFLISAKYIPPEKQTLKMHKQNFWHSNSHKKFLKRREKLNKMKNADVDDEKYIKSTKKTLSKLNKKQKKLEELGVNIQFKPVDVPEELKTEKVKTFLLLENFFLLLYLALF